LVPELRRVGGFWDRSAGVDPLGSAREILRWRDELVLSGWTGRAEGMPRRVADIARLAAGVLPGVPDRVVSVLRVLGKRSADIASLELLEPRLALPSGSGSAYGAEAEVSATRTMRERETDLVPVCGSHWQVTKIVRRCSSAAC
jgi:hypothetical protein